MRWTRRRGGPLRPFLFRSVAASLAVLAAACSLPPPVEERPLDAGVEVTSPRIDSTLSSEGAPEGADVESPDGRVEVAAPGASEAAEGRPAQDAETDVIEVQSSESSPLTRVGDAEDTVAAAEADPPADVGDDGAAAAPGGEAANGEPADGDAGATEAGDGATEPTEVTSAADGDAAAPSADGTAASDATEPDSTDPDVTAPDAAATDAAAPAGSAADGAETDDVGVARVGDGASSAAPLAEEAPVVAALAIERRRLPGADDDAAAGPSYLVGGPPGGRAVVFIHGFGGNAEQWRLELGRLAPERRVLAIDLPGHGQSVDVAREEWTIPRFAEDVIALLRAEEITEAVLVGHAMGGKVALVVAARAPGDVAAVVGVDSLQALAGAPSPGRFEEHLESFRADFPGALNGFVKAAVGVGTPEDVIDRIARDMVAVDQQVALALMEHFGEYDIREVTSSVQCEVACINSDVQVTEEENNRALLSTFEVTVLEGVGHWVHLEAPDRFHGEFVSRLESFAAPVASIEPAVRAVGAVLVAEDAAALANFYVEVLAFEVTSMKPADGEGAIVRVELERNGAALAVQSLASYRADLGDTEGAVLAPSATIELEVARIELIIDAMRASAAEFVRETESPDGGRRAVFHDPAGNVILVDESLRDSAGG